MHMFTCSSQNTGYGSWVMGHGFLGLCFIGGFFFLDPRFPSCCFLALGFPIVSFGFIKASYLISLSEKKDLLYIYMRKDKTQNFLLLWMWFTSPTLTQERL